MSREARGAQALTPIQLRLSGEEAQYAMRYLRLLAGRRESWVPHGGPLDLVPDPNRRRQIERFVDRLLTEIHG